MDISARVNSLADKPRTGYRGHQGSYAPGRPILHRRLILSQTSAGTTKGVDRVDSVGEQAALSCEERWRVDRRHVVSGRRQYDRPPSADHKYTGDDKNPPPGPLPRARMAIWISASV